MILVSCNRPSIIGTWIDPSTEEDITDSIGFTLQEDGKVVPINMGYSEFKSWEKTKDGRLVLNGSYTGTNPHEFSDTMNIVTVSKDSLVLEQGGYKVSYVRR